MQRRLRRVAPRGEFGRDLVGRVQHPLTPRRGGIHEHSGEVCAVREVCVAGVGPPRRGTARERQQQRRDIDARGQSLPLDPGRAGERSAQVADVQRHPDRLLVDPGALAAQPMRAGVLAVVGGEDDDRVGGDGRRRGEHVEHGAEVVVDIALQLQVGVEHARPRRARPPAGERDLAEGPCRVLLQRPLHAGLARVKLCGRLEVRRQLPAQRRHRRLGPDEVRVAVPPRDVVGVDEGHRRAPRAVRSVLGEPASELLRDQGVGRETLPGRAVGRGERTAREAPRLERGAARQMPLPVPPGLVALIAQHPAEGRKAGIELAAPGYQAARLMRVQARQERRPRGRAVVGGRVMAPERHGARAQPGEVGQQLRERRRRRPPAGTAHLIDEHDEDVRRRRRGDAERATRGARERRRAERERGAGPQRASEERAPVEARGFWLRIGGLAREHRWSYTAILRGLRCAVVRRLFISASLAACL